LAALIPIPYRNLYGGGKKWGGYRNLTLSPENILTIGGEFLILGEQGGNQGQSSHHHPKGGNI
jgi:hypothetical protein